MLLRTSRTDAAVMAACATLALVGMLLLRNGNTNGWWMLLAFSCTVALVLLRPYLPSVDRDDDGEVLDVTAWGVRRFDHGGLHEAVSWADITEVSIVTSRDSDDSEDVHLLLRGRGDNAVLVPHTLAVEHGVLTALETRFPALDTALLVNALMSDAAANVVLWRAPRAVATSDQSGHHALPPLRAAS